MPKDDPKDSKVSPETKKQKAERATRDELLTEMLAKHKNYTGRTQRLFAKELNSLDIMITTLCEERLGHPEKIKEKLFAAYAFILAKYPHINKELRSLFDKVLPYAKGSGSDSIPGLETIEAISNEFLTTYRDPNRYGVSPHFPNAPTYKSDFDGYEGRSFEDIQSLVKITGVSVNTVPDTNAKFVAAPSKDWASVRGEAETAQVTSKNVKEDDSKNTTDPSEDLVVVPPTNNTPKPRI